MYPDGWSQAPAERPTRALGGPATPDIPSPPAASRAVIVEPDPAVRGVLEYLLARDGFRTEAHAEGRLVEPGPALLLVAAGEGLHVVESRDAAATLTRMSTDARASPGDPSGIRAFLPKPFGARDVMRAVRTVSDSGGGDRTGAT